MNAVMKPQWQRLKTQLIDGYRDKDFLLGNLTLEADECLQWLDEEDADHKHVGDHLLDAVAESYVRDETFGKRFDALTVKLMSGTMTVDELCEWRDMHRSALIDMCSKWARRELEERV